MLQLPPSRFRTRLHTRSTNTGNRLKKVWLRKKPMDLCESEADEQSDVNVSSSGISFRISFGFRFCVFQKFLFIITEIVGKRKKNPCLIGKC